MSASCLITRVSARVLLITGVAALGDPAIACTIRPVGITSPAIAYDPFKMSGSDGQILVTVELAEGDTCSAPIWLADRSGAPLRTIAFNAGPVYTLAVRQDIGIAPVDDSIAQVDLTTSRPRATIAWQLKSAGDAVLPPGDYTVPITAVGAVAVDSLPGSITLHSIARTQANLAGIAGSFESGSDTATIDLGELKTGGTGRAVLQVRGNTTAHLSFLSANRGWLVNAATPQSRIAYTLTIDGDPIDLASAAQKTVELPQSLRGTVLPLVATVGDTRGATAGRYSDTLTIDISP
jgi:hypothetical protein